MTTPFQPPIKPFDPLHAVPARAQYPDLPPTPVTVPEPKKRRGSWELSVRHLRAAGWRGALSLTAALVLVAAAAGAGGLLIGKSDGKRKTANAVHQRDAAAATAAHQVTAAQQQRDAATKQAQQILAGEQPAKDAAATAKAAYTSKLNSLNSLAAQLKQREAADTRRETADQQKEYLIALAERRLQAAH